MLITERFVFVHLQKTGGNFRQGGSASRTCRRIGSFPNDLDDGAFGPEDPRRALAPLPRVLADPPPVGLVCVLVRLRGADSAGCPRRGPRLRCAVRLFDRGRRRLPRCGRRTSLRRELRRARSPAALDARGCASADCDLYTLWLLRELGQEREKSRREKAWRFRYEVETLREDFLSFPPAPRRAG